MMWGVAIILGGMIMIVTFFLVRSCRFSKFSKKEAFVLGVLTTMFLTLIVNAMIPTLFTTEWINNLTFALTLLVVLIVGYFGLIKAQKM